MTKFRSNKLLATIGTLLRTIPLLNFIGIFLTYRGMDGLVEYYNDNTYCKIQSNTPKLT